MQESKYDVVVSVREAPRLRVAVAMLSRGAGTDMAAKVADCAACGYYGGHAIEFCNEHKPQTWKCPKDHCQREVNWFKGDDTSQAEAVKLICKHILEACAKNYCLCHCFGGPKPHPFCGTVYGN